MKATFKKSVLAALLGAAATLAPQVARSGFSIDWYTVDGGGGESRGGSFTLNGTIGQPDAGDASGGDFDLHGGFWGLFYGECGNTLSIVQSGGAVVISWPGQAGDCILEYSDNLNDPANWQPVSPQPAGTVYTVSPDQPARFFRLRSK